MNKTKIATRKMRKLWKQVVDKTLAKDNESKIITDARRKLFMGLFDDIEQEG